jgi:hypothetical protein
MIRPYRAAKPAIHSRRQRHERNRQIQLPSRPPSAYLTPQHRHRTPPTRDRIPPTADQIPLATNQIPLAEKQKRLGNLAEKLGKNDETILLNRAIIFRGKTRIGQKFIPKPRLYQKFMPSFAPRNSCAQDCYSTDCLSFPARNNLSRVTSREKTRSGLFQFPRVL